MRILLTLALCLSAFAQNVVHTGTGAPVGWGANGRNYSVSANGKLYGGATTATVVLDMHAGTPGNAPDATTLAASAYGLVVAGDVTNMGAGMRYFQDASAFLPLLFPAAISGTNYSGTSIAFGGVTTIGGNNIREITITGVTGSNTNAVGFSVWTDCPGTIGLDCGAMGGWRNIGGQYSVVHFRQFGSLPGMSVALENQPGGQIDYWQLPTWPMAVRVNIETTNTGANNRMIVCDANNRLLYRWAMNPFTSAPNSLWLGITGEEPAVAGYNYRWWNFVVSSTRFNYAGPCF